MRSDLENLQCVWLIVTLLIIIYLKIIFFSAKRNLQSTVFNVIYVS